ncbi:hypothetical protein H5410_060008 [Solanum commersonii]|uniref:Uncharacterized protein n=1 Tax=Solanum commersonii TaxID=4109 RepID=A0A9J5W413_SOLCO|nr:hypothetical protein H5410_060008 [Solanum commersonii]
MFVLRVVHLSILKSQQFTSPFHFYVTSEGIGKYFVLPRVTWIMISYYITFSNLILDILTQVEQSAEIAHDFDGLVIVGGVDSKTNAHLYAANLSSKPQSTAVALAAKLKLVIFLLVS